MGKKVDNTKNFKGKQNTNGFKKGDPRTISAAKKGGQAKHPKHRIIDAQSDETIANIAEAHRLYVKHMIKKAKEGDFAAYEWYESYVKSHSDNRKIVEVVEDKTNSQLDINIKIEGGEDDKSPTVPKDKE